MVSLWGEGFSGSLWEILASPGNLQMLWGMEAEEGLVNQGVCHSRGRLIGRSAGELGSGVVTLRGLPRWPLNSLLQRAWCGGGTGPTGLGLNKGKEATGKQLECQLSEELEVP